MICNLIYTITTTYFSIIYIVTVRLYPGFNKFLRGAAPISVYCDLNIDSTAIILHKKWSFQLRISSVNVIKPIWSHLLKKPLMENFIFCAAFITQRRLFVARSLLEEILYTPIITDYQTYKHSNEIKLLFILSTMSFLRY